jgi:hypothetical protein
MEQQELYDECARLLNGKGLRKVHPSFRLLALAEPPGKERDRWLQSEVLPMFAFEILPNMSLLEKVMFVTEGGCCFFVVVHVGGTIALAYETTCLCNSS